MILSFLINGLVALIALLAIAFTALYLFFQNQFKYWSKRNVPHSKPSIPLGSFTGINHTYIGTIFKKIYDESKHLKYYGIWQLHTPVLFINDPELIKKVLVADFMSFHDHVGYFNEKDDPLAANLFVLEGSAWRNLRVKLTPIFTSGKMKIMFPFFVECGKNLQEAVMEYAKVGDVFEAKEFAARYTTDVISSCAFGVEANSLKDPDAIIRKMGRKAVEPTWNVMIRVLLAFFVPDLAALLKMRVTNKEVSDFFMKTFREVIEYREKNNVKRNDAMQLLIELMKKGQIDDVDAKDGKNDKDAEIDKAEKFTFEQLAAQAFIFFVGGYETSSTVMQFALYELAKNQDIQSKLRDEIQKVLARYKGEITYDGIYEMEYLGRVIEETLRKYPAVAGLPRKCTRNFKVPDSDLVIEKGTIIGIPTYGLHWDERYFPNPEKFDPERFTEEQKAKRHHYTYLPFGEGPRVCIGMRFGQMQTRVGLVSLISKFKIELSEIHSPKKIELDPRSFIASPKGGMRLKISLIDD